MPSAALMVWEPYIRLAAFLGVLTAMALWEFLAPFQPLRQSRFLRWSGNIGVLAVGTVAVRVLVPLAPVAAAQLAAAWDWGLLNSLPLPGWTAFLVALIALDFIIYVQHRIMHGVPLFWRLHRMHHSDLELDATTALRFHPLEILLSLALKLAAVMILGASPGAVMIFEVVLNATSLFNHANVRLPPGLERYLRLILVTPLMHRVHHSVVRTETDSNFGFNLPWWDRILGTYRSASASGYAEMRIGLPEFRDPIESRLDRLLLQPFISPK